VVYKVNSCPTCEPPVLEAIADFLAAAVTDREAGAAWRPQRDYTLVEPTFHPGKPVRPA
jgi:[lysine-biosynthesis-protein LysW]--L-2-aminoadipate ligase/ribosomal protein S6--L-glutamate ligase